MEYIYYILGETFRGKHFLDDGATFDLTLQTVWRLYDARYNVTHFKRMFHFYTPENVKKTDIFRTKPDAFTGS